MDQVKFVEVFLIVEFYSPRICEKDVKNLLRGGFMALQEAE